MPSSYFNQLFVIRDMLKSPHLDTEQNGLNLLSELLKDHSEDSDFINEVRRLTNDVPALKSKIIEMVDQASGKNSQLLPKNSMEKKNSSVSPVSVPKIFISYSHKDEKFKDEFVTMLIPLQNHDVIEIWQDRQIEEGDEWYQAIKDAMNTCDLALLLVSKHFLASSFISGEELPHLLQRRKQQGLRIIPIIISQCIWQSIPVLKDLQALPKDGKPVVSFKGTGGRDRVWTEIARVIEGQAKNLVKKN